MSIAVIIPARYGSTRLPGKPLADICGKPMVEWVLRAASGSKLATKIILATDDERIIKVVNALNIPNVTCAMTSKNHESGTDRIFEVVKKDPSIKYVVNLQGDEPAIPSSYIDKVIEPLLNGYEMSTLITPLTDLQDLQNPNIVKVVIDKNGYAIYFSRANIPFDREGNIKEIYAYRHMGIYGYTRESILKFTSLPQSALEKIEKLEQLRALENGMKIKVEIVEKATSAVDTAEDIKIVEKELVG